MERCKNILNESSWLISGSRVQVQKVIRTQTKKGFVSVLWMENSWHSGFFVLFLFLSFQTNHLRKLMVHWIDFLPDKEEYFVKNKMFVKPSQISQAYDYPDVRLCSCTTNTQHKQKIPMEYFAIIPDVRRWCIVCVGIYFQCFSLTIVCFFLKCLFGWTFGITYDFQSNFVQRYKYIYAVVNIVFNVFYCCTRLTTSIIRYL